MDFSGLSKKEYLKKYLSGGEKKKKRKKSTQSLIIKSKIVDDDIDLKNMKPVNEDELEIFDLAEDAPQIAGIIDERPEEIRIMSEYRSTKKWKIVTDEFGIEDVKITAIDRQKSVDGSPKREKEISIEIRKNSSKNFSDSEDSFPKKDQNEELNVTEQEKTTILKSNIKIEKDFLLPEKKKDVENSKKKEDSDESPPRRKRQEDSDESLPRRKQQEDSDESPPRRKRKDSDESPPRRKRKEESDESPLRRRRRKDDSDESPPRRRRRKDDSDKSPPRRKKRKDDSDESPPRRKKRKDDSDESPPRRRKKREDSDESPPRRKRNEESIKYLSRNSKPCDSDIDYSSLNKIKIEKDPNLSSSKSKVQSDFDSSFRTRHKRNSKETLTEKYHNTSKNQYNKNLDKRRERHQESEDSKSPTNKDASKGLEKDERYGLKLNKNRKDNSAKENQNSQLSKTLSGKKAGLQSAEDMRKEGEKLRQKEEEAFEKMPDEITGKNAQAIMRDRKTGRRRDVKEEARKKREKEEKEAERIAKYAVWGKGVKQVQDSQEKLKDDLYEMSKPLARYKDDKDLDEMLKNQEREGDPMLDYIRRKKQKDAPEKLIPEYEGSYMPNRYGIKPGHKWDGVDRSNGYEKRWFEEQSARKAREEEAFKWSTADM